MTFKRPYFVGFGSRGKTQTSNDVPKQSTNDPPPVQPKFTQNYDGFKRLLYSAIQWMGDVLEGRHKDYFGILGIALALNRKISSNNPYDGIQTAYYQTEALTAPLLKQNKISTIALYDSVYHFEEMTGVGHDVSESESSRSIPVNARIVTDADNTQFEQLEIPSLNSNLKAIERELDSLAPAQQMMSGMEGLTDEYSKRETEAYVNAMNFRRLDPLPEIVLDEQPSPNKNNLVYYTSWWTGIWVLVCYAFSVISESTLAYQNGVSLLQLSPIKSALFAGIIVSISFLLSFLLIRPVEALLRTTKPTWFFIGYAVCTLIMVASFATLSYSRLQRQQQEDKLFLLTQELTSLQMMAQTADRSEAPMWQDLVVKKDAELRALTTELNRPQTEFEEFVSRLTLVISSLLAMITAACLICVKSIISRVIGLRKKIDQSINDIESSRVQYENLRSQLKKARELIPGIIYLSAKINVLKDLLALPLSGNIEDYLKANSLDDLAKEFDNDDVIEPEVLDDEFDFSMY